MTIFLKFEGNTMKSVLTVCDKNILSEQDAHIIDGLYENLQIIADITEADVFIDCLIPEERAAVVLAHARPTTAKTLYSTTIVGQKVVAENEPGVLFSLLSGQPVIGSRGKYPNEQVVMQQNIVPVKNHTGKTNDGALKRNAHATGDVGKSIAIADS
jgi:hypothetical protein